MHRVRSLLVVALAALAFFKAGCDGCSDEEYHCDETGCYWCDSYGCRRVDPPPPATCRGDWECPPDRPICTRTGCSATCSADADCPEGLDCRDGLCLPSGPVEECGPGRDCPAGHRCEEGRCVVELDPGRCPGGSEMCDPGEFCAPSSCCLPETERGTACCADVDCAAGEVCHDNRCEPPAADAGTDDAGTPGDGGGEVPIPEPQCRRNADCPGAYHLCIDGVCKLPCRTDAECAAGCRCIDGFCTEVADAG